MIGTIAAIFHIGGHSHDHGELAGDKALKDNKLGIRTIYLAVALLGLTTILQIVIYLMSGSVALLGDTVHNLGDAVNSIPLLFAFWLASRVANKRYTYGYGRAEDLAGVLIVLSIGFSAFYILYESVLRLFNPVPLDNLVWVAAAAIIGFAGNELAAIIQIRTGKKIGSDAMIANGLHARTDGLTSLAVLVAAIGAFLGYPIVDAIIGILMGIVILFITKDAAKSMWYRLMDAVDPIIVQRAEAIITEHSDVKSVQRLQMRWIGHRLQAEAVIAIDSELNTTQCNEISEHISHHLYHDIPNLAETTIAVVPWNPDGKMFRCETTHHKV
ncbi:cation diffusion facilitator family transporter [Methanocella sp. MCL-LM]|uniref:cation diffusion facilitator family transporter n=1 Tax=Methanocella sp. MCL-LM TaxID=3412035 RepID=UPI003C716164